MLRFVVENIYGWFTGKLTDAMTSIELEVAAYLCLYRFLTNKELDMCIENYTETIEYFEQKKTEDTSVAPVYERVNISLNKMLEVFKLEKKNRSK
jgi:hypothetical protein